MKRNVSATKWSLCLGVLLAAIAYPGIAQEKLAGQGDKPKAEAKVFSFGGGDLRGFVSAVKEQFGFDLREAASIDRSAFNLRIPKMRFPAERTWQGVLLSYNTLSANTDNFERLGRWVVSPNPHRSDVSDHPEAIIFLPPKNAAEGPGVKVKAFSLDKLKKEDLDALYKTLALEVSNLQESTPGAFEGQIRYHESTGLLIASGSQDYVELATMIVEAFKETLDKRN